VGGPGLFTWAGSRMVSGLLRLRAHGLGAPLHRAWRGGRHGRSRPGSGRSAACSSPPTAPLLPHHQRGPPGEQYLYTVSGGGRRPRPGFTGSTGWNDALVSPTGAGSPTCTRSRTSRRSCTSPARRGRAAAGDHLHHGRVPPGPWVSRRSSPSRPATAFRSTPVSTAPPTGRRAQRRRRALRARRGLPAERAPRVEHLLPRVHVPPPAGLSAATRCWTWTTAPPPATGATCAPASTGTWAGRTLRPRRRRGQVPRAARGDRSRARGDLRRLVRRLHHPDGAVHRAGCLPLRRRAPLGDRLGALQPPLHRPHPEPPPGRSGGVPPLLADLLRRGAPRRPPDHARDGGHQRALPGRGAPRAAPHRAGQDGVGDGRVPRGGPRLRASDSWTDQYRRILELFERTLR
jgi:hypothetical protein